MPYGHPALQLALKHWELWSSLVFHFWSEAELFLVLQHHTTAPTKQVVWEEINQDCNIFFNLEQQNKDHDYKEPILQVNACFIMLEFNDTI